MAASAGWIARPVVAGQCRQSQCGLPVLVAGWQVGGLVRKWPALANGSLRWNAGGLVSSARKRLAGLDPGWPNSVFRAGRIDAGSRVRRSTNAADESGCLEQRDGSLIPSNTSRRPFALLCSERQNREQRN